MEGIFKRRECLKCGLCCLETEMILLKEDIERISSLGYSVDYFAVFDGKYYRLRNIDGRCVFYDPVSGKCAIYDYRPLGCRIYPVIWVEGLGPTVDPYCPLSSELSKEEFAKAVKLLKYFIRKLRSGY